MGGWCGDVGAHLFACAHSAAAAAHVMNTAAVSHRVIMTDPEAGFRCRCAVLYWVLAAGVESLFWEVCQLVLRQQPSACM